MTTDWIMRRIAANEHPATWHLKIHQSNGKYLTACGLKIGIAGSSCKSHVPAGACARCLEYLEKAAAVSPRRCKCGGTYYANHSDGSRTYKWKGKNSCSVCHGTGMVEGCPKCDGCGMLPGSKICTECGGTALVMAGPMPTVTEKLNSGGEKTNAS